MKRILFALLLLSLATTARAQEHALFSAVLTSQVKEGVVDYPNLCRDARLNQYLDTLSAQDPQQKTDSFDQLAFWINAYNAFTLKLICDNYPLKSINDLHTGGLLVGSVLGRTAWDRKFIKINGQLYSLGEIEHKIIRPKFKEPRIHFAIVCAAKGCPPLRSEAYEGPRLNEQLNDQARGFLGQEAKNKFDLASRAASISPIFSWFKKDFGGQPSKVLKFLAPFLPKEVREDLEKNVEAWKIRFTSYDWSLNE